MISDLTFLYHFHQKKSKHETDFQSKRLKIKRKETKLF